MSVFIAFNIRDERALQNKNYKTMIKEILKTFKQG
jgi:ribosomal protein S20